MADRTFRYQLFIVNSMADNFLERKRENYEKKKSAWLQRKKHLTGVKQQHNISRPEDESL